MVQYPRYGFVQFESYFAAARAIEEMNETEIKGRKVTMDWLLPKAEYEEKQGASGCGAGGEYGVENRQGNEEEGYEEDSEDKEDGEGEMDTGAEVESEIDSESEEEDESGSEMDSGSEEGVESGSESEKEVKSSDSIRKKLFTDDVSDGKTVFIR